MMKKTDILQLVKSDQKAAETMQKDWLGKRDIWIQESYGEPYGNEQKGKSAIVSKDIKRQLEWLVPSVADPFLSSPDVIKCNPVTYEDVESAKQNELLLNTQFTRQFNRYNFINKSIRVLAVEGSVVVQTGWDYEDEEVEREVETIVEDEYGNQRIEIQTVTETKVIRNQPTAIVCRNEDIFIDPTCMDEMDKCQFVIHRYETDISTLKTDGRYKNLKKLERMDSDDDTDYVAEDTTYFKFSDKARKKVLVYEYWGNVDVNEDGEAEAIVCAWVGDTIIRLEENPYPDGKPPFIVVPFNPIPFQMFGEALAENIGDNQKVKTAITRGIIDNMAKSNNGQVGIRVGALDSANFKKFDNGENFKFKGTPNDFWMGSYNNIPASAFNMLSMMDNEIESQTGVKSFSGGISGQSLGSTATSARGVMDATSVRRTHLVRNIAENMIKPLMRKWMAYNYEFMEDEDIIRVTNNEFVPIRKDDLDGRIDIEITISTAEDNNAKAQQLSFLLQTLGNSVPFELTQILLADVAKLSRRPMLEKQIREFKPPKDEAAEQMKQMEMQRAALENQKLQAEIQDLQMRAQENGIDAELKRNKAAVEAAKARKLESESDMKDLQFLKENENTSHKEKMELEEVKYRANLDSLAFQAMQGDKQLGVIE